MRIIFQYILREFLKFFLLGLFSFVLIYLIADFLERIGSFMQNNAPLTMALLFFLYKLPLIVFQVTPLACLFSATVSLALRARNFELIAMESCGVSIFRIALPILMASAFISVFAFLGNELIVPEALNRSERLMKVEMYAVGA